VSSTRAAVAEASSLPRACVHIAYKSGTNVLNALSSACRGMHCSCQVMLVAVAKFQQGGILPKQCKMQSTTESHAHVPACTLHQLAHAPPGAGQVLPPAAASLAAK
jgi:hypothetical protein